ncbi:DivIVA domain-containing protein [Spirosoma litoris]
MKITPIEIRQHTFEKGLRGYRTEDVDAFLVSLSQEWERVTGEYKMLKMQLELAEKELGKLKEIEMTLFRTLKSAEENSAQITEQANNAGEKYVNEAKQKAEDILADARKKTALMVQDAENQARYLKDNILNDLKSLEHDFKALEGYKENLAAQIRTLAHNAVDSVERFEKKFNKQNLKGKIDEVSTQIKEELKQEEAHKAETANEAPAAPVASDATELPHLIERDQFVPEAIPEDQTIAEKLDEAVEATQSETSEAVAEVKSTLDQSSPESVLAEVNTPEPEVALNEATEEAQDKKSGSFFDQI